MTDPELAAQLRDLSARLARIERQLGLTGESVGPGEEADRHSATLLAAESTATATTTPTPTVPAAAAPERASLAEPTPAGSTASGIDALLERRRQWQTAPSAVIAEARRATRPLEVRIAQSWMAWVGGLVVVLAVGFFVKLGYDLGWWGRIPPLGKCLLAAAFGVALNVAGEVALRRVGRPAAVSLFGAGLGTLYLTAFASFRYFELVSRNGAFLLMAIVALLGFAITLRGRTVAIGILSLLGGYFTPVLLAGTTTFAAALPLYTTTLLVVALALSAVLPTPFRPLRYVAVALHAALLTTWAYNEGVAHWLLALGFATAWWGLVTAEILIAAVRGQSARSNAIVSLLFTFWYVSLGCGVLAGAEPGRHNWLGVFTGIIAVICAWLALGFGPGLAALGRKPQKTIELLAATLWAQVGILTAGAIAVQFRQQEQSFGMTIGWLVLAVACVELGRRLPARALSIFGLLVGLLALVRVWALDRDLFILRSVAWSYGTITVTYWGLLALGAIAATVFGAARLRPHTPGSVQRGAAALTALAAAQWAALALLQCRGLPLTGAWLAGVGALLAGAALLRLPGAIGAGQALLALAAAKWLLVDALLHRVATGWTPTAEPLLLNWRMALAFAVCAGLYGLYRLYRRTIREHEAALEEAAAMPRLDIPVPVTAAPVMATPDRPAPALRRARRRLADLPLLGALFLYIALSFAVEHIQTQYEQPAESPWPPIQSRMLWITLFWAFAALVSQVVGLARRHSTLFCSGPVLAALVAVVWLMGDTLYWRSEQPPVLTWVIVNLQFLVGAAASAILLATAALLRRNADLAPPERPRDASHPELATPAPASSTGQSWSAASSWPETMSALAGWLAALLGVVLGSLELDRFFAPEAARVSDPAMARQTALSIWWGVYAIAMVAFGFWRRLPAARYAGLGLLGVTLIKVLIVDLARIEYVYRVLSLLAVGLLFIGTSIAYSRLAARLGETPRGASDPAATPETRDAVVQEK